ncbi:MAG: carboxymuconolactone decarboxylase family protein, partial [Nitrospinota bacterium]|nr:carboxymuconolactone decarboxylase family protein [Nitrospinota bacterium]
MMSNDRVEKALEIRKKLGIYGEDGYGGVNELAKISPVHAQSILEFCYGTGWNQPLIDTKTRELLVIAAAAAQDLPGEVGMHTRGALNQGWTHDEIVEAIVGLCAYI